MSPMSVPEMNLTLHEMAINAIPQEGEITSKDNNRLIMRVMRVDFASTSVTLSTSDLQNKQIFLQ